MHPQPLPTTAASSPGKEDDGSAAAVVVAVEKREDFSEKINLDLGIGICGFANEKIKQEKREPFFTTPQFHEFHNQVLVCNPINFGLPLFIGFSPKTSDQTSTMDTEPGRCRRTDGRKWRCSKSVIPNQKYCERHMHRGRRNSRKHTSAPIEGVPIPDTKTPEDNRNIVAISNPSDLDSSRLYPSRSSNGGSAISRHKSEENSDGLFVIPRKIINREHTHTVAKNDYVGFVSPRFGLSPKSVLHSNAGSKSNAETSLQRCQRTDGKKWQCKKDVVPNQKYCELHMHRGAKRIVSNRESSGKVPETSSRRARISCTTSLGSIINLNTVAANPQRHFTENNSTGSSTSDATTITD